MCHISNAGLDFADSNITYPVQRDGYGCSYYAALSIIQLKESFKRTNSYKVDRLTFDTTLYDVQHFLDARRLLLI
jgi:hypothetical protein